MNKIESLKRAIDKSNLSWTPGETSVSGLNSWQQRRRMGVLLPDEETLKAEMLMKPAAPPEKFPRAWDWRDVEGMNFVSPVKDQGGCGSCWAFGTIAQLESAVMIKAKSQTWPDFSEQYMVSCSTANYGCRGGYMIAAYEFVRDNGVPEETCFPYKAKDLECSDACENPTLTRCQSVERLGAEIATLKAAVYKQPITVAMRVYSDFFYYRSGIYSYASGTLRGAHAICVVGYDNRCFVAKNSWGPRWGEDGFFRISLKEAGYDSMTRFGMQSGRLVL